MHLVLRRAPGQSIVIGKEGQIKITFHREENGIAHIGIDAPKSIIVNRLEVHERKLNEQSQSRNSSVRK